MEVLGSLQRLIRNPEDISSGDPKIKDANMSSSSVQTADEPELKNFRGDHEKLSWEQYFMGLAFISAERSKDPKRQVGACIVNSKYRILALGDNGMPDNIEDCNEKWKQDTKETFVCHAEQNAVLNRGANDVRGCTMYVTYYPCSNCAKLIIQSGVKKIVYYEMYSDKRKSDGEEAGKMLEGAGVEIKEYKREKGTLIIKASDKTKGLEKTL